VANKVDLLVSVGNTPVSTGTTVWATGTNDRLEDQLIANVPGYTARIATSSFGWNGPYVSNAIGADPWGNRYMVNVGQIDTTQGTQGVGGTTKNAVWVISAGPNGVIETTHTQSITAALIGGDDIGIRLQ
jgi:hypothetical protein